MHGKLSQVSHQGRGVFAGLPAPLTATRYHSLTIDPASFPHDHLEVTATAEDGVIMGLQHRTLPIYGVQFHPESIASQEGHALLLNFLNLAEPAAAAGSDGPKTGDSRTSGDWPNLKSG